MIAGLVSQLIAAGVAPELAATVVTEAFVAGATSTGIPRTSAHEKRKEYDRERKRKERMSTGIPPDSTGHADTALTLKKDNNKIKKVRVAKHLCPPDWKPKSAHYDAAEKLHIPRSAVDAKAEDMRIWAGSTGAMKVDWDLTFHGFLRRDAPKLAHPPPPKSTDGPGFYAPFGSAQLDAWDKTKPGGYPRDKAGGWRFPTEWPPGYKQEAA
jgi:hypothetical protein